MGTRDFQIFVVRYVGDIASDKSKNIAVCMSEISDGDGRFLACEYTDEWEKLKVLFPDADVEFLKDWCDAVRKEFCLNGTRISDHDLHNFRPGRLGSRVPFRGVHGFHVTIMPKSARTRCGPHHTLLVMNSEAHTYFRGATLVHNVGGRILPPGVRPRP